MANSIIPFSAELAQQLIESANGFPVDFDLAWQWLGFSRRDSALRKLKRFKDGEDFHQIVEKTTGRDLQRFWLSVECFKMLGMLAQTEQGDQVRSYFLECERIAKQQSAPLSVWDTIIASAQAQKLIEQRQDAMEQLLLQSIAQKDEEIRLLKATVEVVDMESQANSAELERFRNGHGYYFSIAGWCSKQGWKLALSEMNNLGRKATAMCKTMGIQPVPVNDPRWGTVNTYPDSVLMELV
jgi:phage anti-repressor protein